MRIPQLALLAFLTGCGRAGSDTPPLQPRPPSAEQPYDRGERDIAAADRDVIEHADSFTIVRLDPDGPPGKGAFHGFTVKSRASVRPADRRPLLDLLRRSITESSGDEMMCFRPHHGIEARKGGITVDLVICFQCDQIYVYGESPRRVPVVATHVEEIDRIFVELGAR